MQSQLTSCWLKLVTLVTPPRSADLTFFVPTPNKPHGSSWRGWGCKGRKTRARQHNRSFQRGTHKLACGHARTSYLRQNIHKSYNSSISATQKQQHQGLILEARFRPSPPSTHGPSGEGGELRIGIPRLAHQGWIQEAMRQEALEDLHQILTCWCSVPRGSRFL